jgi:putative two-component system response regulator
MDQKPENTTIMVIDDTPHVLKQLQKMLEAKGYRVLTYPSGKPALQAALITPPDLILLDIKMPDMNGLELCAQLKANAALKDIPLLFMSALTDTAEKVKAFSCGGVDYLTKPFQSEEVHARVETHLRLRRAQIELEKYNLHLEDLVREKVAEISDSQMATIVALAKMAESRDDDTGVHIERTQTFCKLLAEKLRDNPNTADQINETFVENIFNAAPLHDIGKVGIADHILLKPGKLTLEEFEVMKTHTLIGANTLQTVYDRYPRNIFLNMGIAIARSHHEKWDGSGYPEGLAGKNIPFAARIMAVADVYDALRSKRPYKPAFTHEKSCAIIQAGAGRHFDPEMIAAFRSIETGFAETRERMDEKADLKIITSHSPVTFK